jgi:hypothetical protein
MTFCIFLIVCLKTKMWKNVKHTSEHGLQIFYIPHMTILFWPNTPISLHLLWSNHLTAHNHRHHCFLGHCFPLSLTGMLSPSNGPELLLHTSVQECPLLDMFCDSPSAVILTPLLLHACLHYNSLMLLIHSFACLIHDLPTNGKTCESRDFGNLIHYHYTNSAKHNILFRGDTQQIFANIWCMFQTVERCI